MAISRQKKEAILNDLTFKMKDARSVVFARYAGVSVKLLSFLRRKLREEQVEFKVAKKTLIHKAAQQAFSHGISEEILQGQVALGLSSKDEVIAAKLFYDFSKKQKCFELVGGIIEGKLLNQQEIKEIALLPAKEQLLAKLIGTLQAPVYGFYRTLHGVPCGFVRVLNAYEEKHP